jgi:uncharacterized protein (TIRG00374 family)
MKNYLIFFLKLFVTSYLFFVVFKKIGYKGLEFSFAKVNYLYIALSLFLIYGNLVVVVYRWSLLTKHFWRDNGFIKSLELQFVANFLNQIIPTGLGGDIYKVYFLRKEESLTLSKSTSIVVLERMIGFITLLMISIFFSALLFHGYKLHSQLIFNYLLFSSLSLFILILMISLRDFLLLLSVPFYKLNSILAGIVNIFIYPMEILKSKKLNFALSCILIHGLNIAILFALSFSLGIILPFESLYLFPSILLLSAIPISIGGWGLREGLMLTGLGLIGVDPGKALLLSISFGTLNLLAYIPAIFFLLKQDGIK